MKEEVKQEGASAGGDAGGGRMDSMRKNELCAGVSLGRCTSVLMRQTCDHLFSGRALHQLGVSDSEEAEEDEQQLSHSLSSTGSRLHILRRRRRTPPPTLRTGYHFIMILQLKTTTTAPLQ
ncbi:unnamed protein product [Pleuronectes platessa]|uniref:Uncharacterized protein n=1 Tax=Pleuronectes platessa TaxID=8262 RepID=A0A9N7UZZ7_PLEPL|nr:unnamed protein product [Pleuronectes platessa]